MSDSQRIEDLRRRVQKDPTSIAFAQLAEECRRAGNLQEAVDVCRAGLAIHPGYLSARVTLGRALVEMDDLTAALVELEYVLKSAPENLAAIRGLAEIHHRQGRLESALTQYRAALLLARNDPDLQRTVDELTYQLEPPAPAEPDEGLSLQQAQDDFLKSLSSPQAAVAPELPRDAEPEPPPEATTGAELELEPNAPVHAHIELEAEPQREAEPEHGAVEESRNDLAGAEAEPDPVALAIPVERVTVEDPAPEQIAEREAESAPEPELELEPASLASAMVPDPVVPWDAAPALIPQPALVESVDVEVPPEDTAERDRALRMIAALEQWIDAIHVVRAQPLA